MTADLDQIRAEMAAIGALAAEPAGAVADIFPLQDQYRRMRRYTDAWANVGRHVPALVDEIEQLRQQVLQRDYWARDVVFYHELSEQPGDDHFATIAKHLKTALAEASAVRDAAHRHVIAYQKGDEQLCADVRTIRRNLAETGCCDVCRPAVTAAFNDLGQLLADMPDGSDT